MRAYVKPDIEVTTFVPNEAIASCSSTDNYTYDAQEVNCIISGKDYVFYTGCSNSVTSSDLVTYNGVTYFIWTEVNSNTTGGTQPSEDKTALLKAIVAAGNHEIDDKNSDGWHAGPVTPTIIKYYNHS